jgi:hypothetical protein
MKYVHTLCMILLVATLANAAQIKSTANGGNWSSASTWQTNTVPTVNDDVIIDGNVTIGSNVSAKSVVINANKTLTINGNNTLTINTKTWWSIPVTNYGNLVTNNGTILIEGNGVGLYPIKGNATQVSNLILSDVTQADFSNALTITNKLTLQNNSKIQNNHPTYGVNAILEIAQNITINGNYYLWANGSGNDVAPYIHITGNVTSHEVNLTVKKGIYVAPNASFNAGKTCIYLHGGFESIDAEGTIRLGGITVRNGVKWNINNNYTMSTLKIENGGIVNAQNSYITIDNSMRNNCNINSSNIMEVENGGQFNAETGTVKFIPAYWVNLNANNIVGGIVFNNVVVAGNSVLNIANINTMSINGNLLVETGSTLNNPGQINFGPYASMTVKGNVTPPLQTPLPGTVSGPIQGLFNQSVIVGQSGANLTGDVIINGNRKVVIVPEGVTLDANIYRITCDTVYINGTLTTQHTQGLVGNFAANTIIVFGPHATVSYNANVGSQSITPRTDYANLILTNNANKNFTIGTYKISGDFIVSGKKPSFTNTTNIIFNGTNQTITCPEFINVEFANAGIKTLGSKTEVIGVVTLKNNVTLVSNGNLVLVSNANFTASVAELPSSANITGDIIVQRYIPSVARRSRMLAANTANFTFSQYKDNIFVTGTNGEANGFDASPNNGATIYTFQETLNGGRGWKAINSINQPLQAGAGSLVFIRGDRTLQNWNKSPYPAQNQVTIDFVGPINRGDISPVVTHTSTGDETADGWNMLGNPYPSAVDWTKVTKHNVSPFYYLLDPISGSYIVNANNNIIASGQAFFVQALGPNPSVTFTESSKTNANAIFYFKNASNPLTVKMTKDALNSDLAFLNFNENGSKNLNLLEDALKMTNSTINVSFITNNGTALQYNTVPTVNTIDTFLLNVAAANGSYTLSLSEFNGIPSNFSVYLRDLFTNNFVDIRSNPDYTFSITSNAASKGNRFQIIVADPSALPVTWLSVSAQTQGEDVVVKWSTASEKNNAGFTVETSTDNQNWAFVANVGGAGNSSTVNNYTIIHNNAFNNVSTVYYRVKQTDKSGEFAYSDVVSASLNNKAIVEINVYPNPTKGNVTISNLTLNNTVTAEVYDIYGKKVLTTEFYAGSTDNTLATEAIEAGVYTIRLIENGEVISTTKFVKE